MSVKSEDTFVVRSIGPERALVLGDAAGGMTWAFAVQAIDQSSARLIIRVRATYDSLAFGLFLKAFLRPIHCAMAREQLLNLKRLVEAAA